MARRRAQSASNRDSARESLRQGMDQEGVCKCGHWRTQHILGEPEPTGFVKHSGPCTVLPCHCKGFTFDHMEDSHR